MVTESDPDRRGLVRRTVNSTVVPLVSDTSTPPERRAAALKTGAMLSGAGVTAVAGADVFGHMISRNQTLLHEIAPYANGALVDGTRGFVVPMLLGVFSGSFETRRERNAMQRIWNVASALSLIGVGSLTVAAVAGTATGVVDAASSHTMAHIAADLAGVSVGTAATARIYGIGRPKPVRRPPP